MLKSVRVQYSVNGGSSWQTAPLSRKGSSWIARLPDPASGFVSLRSEVVNTAGDSTVQTIYSAYAVS